MHAQGVGQNIGRVVKTGFLTLPLIAAAWFFGLVCRWVEAGHLLLAFTPQGILPLLRDLLLSLVALAVTSSLVAILLRPLWVAGLAFALSGLAMLLGWAVTVPHTLLALLVVLAAVGHHVLTQRDLSQRVRFSVASVTLGQFGLLIVLAVVAASALYLGAADYIGGQGFSIPAQYSAEFAERLATRVAAPFPALIQEQVHNTVRSYAEQLLTEELQQLTKPLSPYVPVAAALGLFLPLLVLCLAISLLALLVLWLLLALLRATGVTRAVTETIEVEKVMLL